MVLLSEINKGVLVSCHVLQKKPIMDVLQGPEDANEVYHKRAN